MRDQPAAWAIFEESDAYWLCEKHYRFSLEQERKQSFIDDDGDLMLYRKDIHTPEIASDDILEELQA